MRNHNYYQEDETYHSNSKSPNKFEINFEQDDSHNTEDFSEKKRNINLEEFRPKSHFSGEKDKFPIQIIKYNVKKNLFEFNDVAEEILTKYDGNVGFVSLAGRYRTGKSFLLNRLLDLSGDGFRVDPSTTACTEGIWMWADPLYIESKKMHLFFLDTEGADSVERDRNHDAKIFSLAILMSSLFIFNSVGSIDEKSISQLSLTTTLSKNIALSSNKNSSEHDEAALARFTPKFIWLLRDFTLELQDDHHRTINPTQYLENALRDQTAISKSNEQNRKIRNALLNFFKTRDCVTMVRPVVEEDDLKNLNKLPNHKLRKEFTAQLKALKEKILSESEPKQLNGTNLNARMFCGMLRNFIDSINQGGVPNIASAWEFIVENECINSYNDALTLYNEQMKNYLTDDPKTYQDIFTSLRNIRDVIMEQFRASWNSKDKNSLFHEYQKKVKTEVDEKEHKVFQLNEQICEANNKKILNFISEEIVSNVNTNYYSIDNIQQYFADFMQFLEEYDKKTIGAKKTVILIDFLQQFLLDSVHSFLNMNKKDDFQRMNDTEVFKKKEADYKTTIKSLESKNSIFQERLIKIERELTESHKNLEDPDKAKIDAIKIDIDLLKENSRKKHIMLQEKNQLVHNLDKELDDLKHQWNKLNKSSFCCCSSSNKKKPLPKNQSPPKNQIPQKNNQNSQKNQIPPRPGQYNNHH